MTDSRIIRLAFARPGSKAFKDMTPEEHIERNIYMRNKLKGTACENATDEDLDNMRLKQVEQGLYYENDNAVVKLGFDATYADDRRKRAAIPSIYEGMRAKAFNFNIYGSDVDNAKNVVNAFIANFRKFQNKGYGLFIWSKTKGTGKTMLASILLNEAVMRYMTPSKFITVYDYLDMVAESWKNKSGDISTRLKSIENAPLLVLDDIGIQSVDKMANDKLFKLIDKRYSKRLVTIYTSNKEIANLGLDDRITSRIEPPRNFIVHLPEVSVRNKDAERKQEEFLSRLKED